MRVVVADEVAHEVGSLSVGKDAKLMRRLRKHFANNLIRVHVAVNLGVFGIVVATMVLTAVGLPTLSDKLLMMLIGATIGELAAAYIALTRYVFPAPPAARPPVRRRQTPTR